MATVKIGGLERPIHDFNGARGIEAGIRLGEILQKAQAVFDEMQDYSRAYQQRNTIRIPRAVALMQRPDETRDIPEAAWQASGNVLEIEGDPPAFQEVLLRHLPQIVRLAKAEVLKLLAVVLVTEEDFEQADMGGQAVLDEFLDAEAKKLLHRAQLQELFTVASVAWEVVQSQVRADPNAMKLMHRVSSLWNDPTQASPVPGLSSEPTSSNGSPAATTGPAKRSSTTSRSKNSSSSSNAKQTVSASR